MNIEGTPLPDIGVQGKLRLATGRRMGVVTQRDGHTELTLSRVDDPDTCAVSIPLSAEQAAALGSVLGSAQFIAQLSAEQENVEGVTTHQIMIRPGSRCAGRPLGETQMRTRTGTSIVALLRDNAVIGSPCPDHLPQSGDLVVIVGAGNGLKEAAEIPQSRT